MKIFGKDEAKGQIKKFIMEKGIEARSIVHISGFTDVHDAYVLDFSAANQERLALMPCFGKKTYVFAYGHDMGSSRSTCTLLIFLGSKDCKPGDNTGVVRTLTGYYKDNRLSVSGKRIAYSLCGDGGFASGYLISMHVKAYNPDLNAVTVTVTYMTTPPL